MLHEKQLHYLQQLLVVEVIAWIKFKDEDMIDTWRPPAIGVDAEQEDTQYDKKHASVHAQCRMPVESTRTHLEIHYKQTTHRARCRATVRAARTRSVIHYKVDHTSCTVPDASPSRSYSLRNRLQSGPHIVHGAGRQSEPLVLAP